VSGVERQQTIGLSRFDFDRRHRRVLDVDLAALWRLARRGVLQRNGMPFVNLDQGDGNLDPFLSEKPSQRSRGVNRLSVRLSADQFLGRPILAALAMRGVDIGGPDVEDDVAEYIKHR